MFTPVNKSCFHVINTFIQSINDLEVYFSTYRFYDQGFKFISCLSINGLRLFYCFCYLLFEHLWWLLVLLPMFLVSCPSFLLDHQLVIHQPISIILPTCILFLIKFGFNFSSVCFISFV